MAIKAEIRRQIKEIRDDKTHGASELARQALDVLRITAAGSRAGSAAGFRAEMQEICLELMSLRPAMAPLYNVVKCVGDALNSRRSGRETLVALIDGLIEASVRASDGIAAHALEVLADNDIVLTHSYSFTVAAALKAAYPKHHITVVITRSGAGRTGERTAWEMDYAGVPAVFIDDTAAGLYLSRVNKVLVGADSICADGGLVNGVGTSLMAAACKYYKVPLYVLCEKLKFDTRLKSEEVELEEKETGEVAAAGVLPEGTAVKNPYFDITPLAMITGVITEDGLVKRSQVLDYLRKLRADNRL